jgi:uncharacterized Fe-S cluster protein YjdI
MGEYRGSEIIIRYDEHICTHSGNCVRSLPSVFDSSRKPWVDADGSTVDEIKKTIALCPSGALTCEEIPKGR